MMDGCWSMSLVRVHVFFEVKQATDRGHQGMRMAAIVKVTRTPRTSVGKAPKAVK
jgi:hypothetical protein